MYVVVFVAVIVVVAVVVIADLFVDIIVLILFQTYLPDDVLLPAVLVAIVDMYQQRQMQY